jgi:hypothetical protein
MAGATAAARLAVATAFLIGGTALPAHADDPPDPDPIGIGPLPLPPLPLFPPPAPPPGPSPRCSTADRPFVPTSIDLIGIAQGVPVVALNRDHNGDPRTPPISDAGKAEFAFDLGGSRPGATRGNALLNAHTFPDGSALGNRLLSELHPDDQLVVRGEQGWICYRITDRVEVAANSRGARYYATAGKPQVAIAVCSGRRLGPGNWTKRTLWFASPVR